jgi:hypothetical protein
MLELQDDLRGLETKLTRLDEVDLEKGIRSRRDDLRQARASNTESERSTLLDTIRVKLVNYGQQTKIVYVRTQADVLQTRCW